MTRSGGDGGDADPPRTASALLRALGIESPDAFQLNLDQVTSRASGRMDRSTPGLGSVAQTQLDSEVESDSGEHGGAPFRSPFLGKKIGPFLITGELGRGGMGVVLRGRDPELRRDVAVKLLHSHRKKPSPRKLARFVGEAQITAQLDHPAIVPVHQIGVSDEGELYFVMKEVAGQSMRELLDALRRGEASEQQWGRHRLLSAFIQVCNAVAFAHDRGVLHRDLKPANIMLGSFGEVLVMDWGVARVLATPEQGHGSESIDKVPVAKTADGSTVGTMGYMSPEQARGELDVLDARSDVFSLGALLYELLSLQRAYQAANAFALLWAVAQGPPPDPRERAPSRRIPEELSAICLRALSTEPADRYPSAAELGAAVEDFLEGSKRRQLAAEKVEQARERWASYRHLHGGHAELLRRQQELIARHPPSTPRHEKVELLAVQERLAGFDLEVMEAFEAVVSAAEGALTHDPDSPEARSVLAGAHWQRFLDAERAGDTLATRKHAARVLRYDDGGYRPQLEAGGTLSLRSDPPGAKVLCQRVDQRDLIWTLQPAEPLGTTPLSRIKLAPGSYVLTLRREGKRDTLYPVLLARGEDWDSGDQPVPLYSDAQIGEDWLYIPQGPFRFGGDPLAQEGLPAEDPWVDGFFIRRLEVTVGGYVRFLNSVHATDPDEAWRRCPRQDTELRDSEGRLLKRPEPGAVYEVPTTDNDGDEWSPDWPVFGVGWDDARHYCRWFGEQEGGSGYGLPTERQWEKAMRGVDGRLFAWGDRFDATMCKMADSRAERVVPEPVGSFPEDRSVYGVQDACGTVHEWCGEDRYGHHEDRRPLRSGNWGSSERWSRLCSRLGSEPWTTVASYGIRVARLHPLGGDR